MNPGITPRSSPETESGTAREISHGGAQDLVMGPDSITGYSIITVETIEEAAQVAGENPFVASIRVFEISAG